MEPLKTPTAKSILRAINKQVKEHSSLVVHYSNWYVGVTNNPAVRKNGHGSKNKEAVYFWEHYNARSLGIAMAIEKHYHAKGMLETGKTGGVAADSKWVYVYKKYPTIFD